MRTGQDVRNNKWVELVLHAAGWTLFFTLPYLLRTTQGMPPRPPIGFHPDVKFGTEPIEKGHFHYELLFYNFLMVPLFYLNITYIVPRYLIRRKYISFFSMQTGIIFALIFTSEWLHNMWNPGMPGIKIGLPVFLYVLITLFAICYCLMKQSTDTERKQKEKENENLKSELQFLRWQISPHFMFNALNNIVALARIKSDKLEPMLMRLSTLMRYMLYDTDEKKVPIQKEIEYLQSYIDLQSIRFGEELQMISEIHMSDGVDVLIEPMLLIPFVENAFKHGTGTITQLVIHITMTVTNERLIFSIKNKYLKHQSENKDDIHGIGLPNVRRRLNLLYGDNFELDVKHTEDWFLVSLNIVFK